MQKTNCLHTLLPFTLAMLMSFVYVSCVSDDSASAAENEASGEDVESAGSKGSGEWHSSSSSHKDIADIIEEPMIVDTTTVTSATDLPACGAENEGVAFMVGSQDSLYFCISGKWESSVVELVGVSCADGNLIAGSEQYHQSAPPFGFGPSTDSADSVVSSFRRTAVPVKGIAQKGPFRYGASVKVIELDSASRLGETKRVAKTCVISSDGSYQFDGIDLVSPYVKIEASGFYKNELTGGLSSSLVTLNAYVDMTDRDSANVNMLTYLEGPRLMQLMSQGGFQQPLRNMKSQSFREILSAFEISIGSSGQGNNGYNGGFGGFGGFGGWGGNQQSSFTPSKNAEDVTLFDGDDYSAALIAVSIMMQSKGSGSEMMYYANQVAERIKGNGNWDDNNAKAELADKLMMLDAEGAFATIRKNLESWNMGEVADFEKYLRNFWTKVHNFESCNAMTAGQVRHVGNSMSSYFVSYYEQPDGPRDRFICDKETHQWRLATDIEKDTVGLGWGDYDGQIKQGKINSNISYVYEQSKKSWRMATSDDVRDFISVKAIYDSLAPNESVIFVLRHAERTDDTGEKGHLTDNGKKQSQQLGAVFKGADIYFGYSGYTRTLETCENIAIGAGISNASPVVMDAIIGSWYVKNDSKMEAYNSANGGLWNVMSRYAYMGGFTDALYDLESRSKELIFDELVPKISQMGRISILISHDQLVEPLTVYCSGGKVNLRYFENQNWINYLAGVAIIVDSSGNVRYEPVKGLDSGSMH